MVCYTGAMLIADHIVKNYDKMPVPEVPVTVGQTTMTLAKYMNIHRVLTHCHIVLWHASFILHVLRELIASGAINAHKNNCVYLCYLGRLFSAKFGPSG